MSVATSSKPALGMRTEGGIRYSCAMLIRCVAVSWILTACGGGDGGRNGDAGLDAPVGSATIGPSGGAVASSDGVMTLTVPPGALSTATELTIDVVAQSAWPANLTSADPVGAVYALGPEGTAFAIPATLTWQFVTAPANALDAAAPRFIFGYSRSAAGVIEPHIETVSTPAGTGPLRVVSTVGHLSEHLLSTRFFRDLNGGWSSPLGTLTVDQRPGMHGVDVPWSAARIELLPSSLELDVILTVEQDVPAPLMDLSPSPWDVQVHQYGGERVNLTPGQVWMPSALPRYKCTAPGMSTITQRFTAFVLVMSTDGGGNFSNGIIEDTAAIDCHAQKAEYTAEEAALGSTRISPLLVPATASANLADTQGAIGYRIEVPPGSTVRVCVSASMAAGVNYYPQYSPGYTFVDGLPGCTNITSVDPFNPNWVLIKVAGAGSPNNITVATSVP